MSTLQKILFAVILTVGFYGTIVSAEEVATLLNDDADRAAVAKIIEVEYQKKTAATGTLDIFNDNKVYNLKWLSFEPNLIDEQGVVVQRGDFRDINTGNIVAVDAVLGKNDAGNIAFSDWKFVGIKENPNVSAKKEYTDDEIQAFMNDYMAKKAKFTGTFDIYDEKKQVMRNLELGELSKDVRKFGVLLISTMNAKDKKTGDSIKLDVTVENKDGNLSVQSVRIK